MYPELFKIPGLGLPVHTYGVLIVTGFLLALFIASRQARQYGAYENEIIDFGFWALVGGIVGARIVFICVDWRSYFITEPWTEIGHMGIFVPRVLAVWEGGLVYWGSLIGGFFAFLFYSMKHKMPFFVVADMLALGVPIAQTLGRLGCVASGCCYGKPVYHMDGAGHAVSDFPVAMQFPKGSLAYSGMIEHGSLQDVTLMHELGKTVPLFPSQLAESFGTAAIFFMLLWVYGRKSFHGQVMLVYAMSYSILRSTLEMFRGDVARGFVIDGVLSTSQFISIVVVTACLITFVILKRRARIVAQL